MSNDFSIPGEVPPLGECFKIAHDDNWVFNPTRPNPALTQTITEAGVGHDDLLLGEVHPFCGAYSNTSFLAQNPEIFENMVAQGKVHFVLEYSDEFQPVIDSYMDGALDETGLREAVFNSPLSMIMNHDKWLEGEDLSTHRDNFVTMLKNAKDAGMKSVLFVDDRMESKLDNEFFSDPSIQEYFGDLQSSYEQAMENGYNDTIANYNSEIYIPLVMSDGLKTRFLAASEKYQNLNQQDRLDDRGEVENVMRRVGPGEGVFAVYGLGHFTNPMDPDAAFLPGMDDLLEQAGRTVNVVEIYVSESLRPIVQAKIESGGEEMHDPADQRITLREGTIEDVPPRHPGATLAASP